MNSQGEPQISDELLDSIDIQPVNFIQREERQMKSYPESGLFVCF